MRLGVVSSLTTPRGVWSVLAQPSRVERPAGRLTANQSSARVVDRNAAGACGRAGYRVLRLCGAIRGYGAPRAHVGNAWASAAVTVT
jgi:hypothetical protein